MSTVKNQLLNVRQFLWDFQKELLGHLKHQHDVEIGYESSPTEWFQVLTTADRYVWLRELTSLMADIDILTEIENIADEKHAVARSEIERILFSEHPDSHITKVLRPILLQGTLLPFYIQLKFSLKSLPTQPVSPEQAQTERKKWQDELHSKKRYTRN